MSRTDRPSPATTKTVGAATQKIEGSDVRVDPWEENFIDWFTDHIFQVFAVVLWVLFLAAVVSLLAGNPTAINGVIGAGLTALLLTTFCWLDR